MKKALIIEIALLFILAIFVAVTVEYWKSVNTILESISFYKEANSQNEFSHIIETYEELLPKTLTYAVLTTLGILVDISVFVLIAIKDLPLFKPLRDKLTARRQSRAQTKSERAEAKKQAFIEKLEKELNELKKDGE